MGGQHRVRVVGRKVSVGAWIAAVGMAVWTPIGSAAVKDGLVLSLEAARNAGDRFDAAATEWADVGGSGRGGKLVNYEKPTWVGTGKPGDPYCLRLNGKGNYVEMPNPAGFDATGGFSIEALARVYGMPAVRVKREMESANQISSLRSQMRDDKTAEFLLGKVQIEEGTAEDQAPQGQE